MNARQMSLSFHNTIVLLYYSFDTVDAVLTMTEKDLHDMGVKKGHVRLLEGHQQEVKILQKASAL